MKLNEIKDNAGARKRRMIVGRGIGSGKGKTAGRGVKGQLARTGVAIKGFEGGQTPLIRRIGKRGFKNVTALKYTEVTLATIQDAFDSKKLSASKPVDEAVLVAAGLIARGGDGVRLINKGEFTTKATFVVTHVTKGALAAVEKAGGKVEVLPEKVNKLLKAKKA